MASKYQNGVGIMAIGASTLNQLNACATQRHRQRGAALALMLAQGSGTAAAAASAAARKPENIGMRRNEKPAENRRSKAENGGEKLALSSK
jgi:hypothetical protein